MSGEFVVNVRALRREPGTRRELRVAGHVHEVSLAGVEVDESAEVGFSGWLESTRGGVSVAGRVSAPWSGTCRRCLAEAGGLLEADVRELFRDAAELSREPAGGDDSYPVGPDTLDLEPLVRDACILALPLAPLCSESCLGLCPECGADLNRQACSCERPAGTSSSGPAA